MDNVERGFTLNRLSHAVGRHVVVTLQSPDEIRNVARLQRCEDIDIDARSSDAMNGARDRAPELVVMFVPFESALSAAFERDPELLEYGIRQRILVASPVTLLALLRAVAFGWQQQQITENARQIANEGRELYARVLNVLKPFRDAGTHLGRAVEAYDQAIGSLEHRLFPALHRMKDLTASSDELPETSEIRKTPRLPEMPEEQA